MEFAVLGERKMTPDSVHGDPDNLRIELREFRRQLVVESQLIAANGTPVRRVKDEHDGFATQLRERNPLIGRAWQ
jgi:hypothetical protein